MLSIADATVHNIANDKNILPWHFSGVLWLSLNATRQWLQFLSIEGPEFTIHLIILWLPPASSCSGWALVSYAEYLPNRAYVSFRHCYYLALWFIEGHALILLILTK
jgi:hypothetical protein